MMVRDVEALTHKLSEQELRPSSLCLSLLPVTDTSELERAAEAAPCFEP